MNKDYYQILGLSREAKDPEIKSAYRKLALQHHPDRNSGNKEAEEKFKGIAEAYAVLGDSEKRRAYDNFGYTQFRGRFSEEDIFRGFNFKDLFREFGLRFDDNISRGFFHGRGRGKGCGRKRGRCARSFSQNVSSAFDLQLSQAEAIFGTEKELFLRTAWERKKIVVKVPPGVRTGTTLRLSMKDENLWGREDDIYLEVRVVES